MLHKANTRKNLFLHFVRVLKEHYTHLIYEADVMALLIENHEEQHFVIDAPDPIDAIKYRMEKQGKSKK
jgi:antitoxin component HigA of HigAB toxin-antitoxin module